MDPERLDAAARRHGIRLLLRFGSTATGRERADSDVDLGVLLEHVPDSFDALADLIGDLQALVPEREVDIVIVNRADPLLLKQLTEHGELLYGPRRLFSELKIYAFKRYQDYRPFLAMERAYIERRVRALD